MVLAMGGRLVYAIHMTNKEPTQGMIFENRPSFTAADIRLALTAHADTRVYVNGECITYIDASRPSTIEIETDHSATLTLDSVAGLIEDILSATKSVAVANVLRRFCEAEGIELP